MYNDPDNNPSDQFAGTHGSPHPLLEKWQLSEEDIKRLYITPAIESKWDPHRITMETKITDGKINLRGNLAVREAPKRADYILYINAGNPIAVVEAKDNNCSVSHGLQQAMSYALMLDVPFAYSSNGDAFFEHDFLTGQEREIPLEEFPSPDELWSRFEAARQLNELEKQLIAQPYYTSQTTFSPRYYQRNAVNRTLDAIAQGQRRLLLVMATGTGKTYTAFQIVYRLLKAGVIKKVLYLADRNVLVDQSIQQDFSPLSKTIHKVNFAQDDPTALTSYEVYFALYQQLLGSSFGEDSDEGEEEEASELRFAEFFKSDFFDLVIVDECHRGSAKMDSNWRKILEYFTSAIQLGMTATPKETRYASNTYYFGEPVYTYSLREGIDDGFLAPFKVINIRTNIGEGWRPYKGQRDIFGHLIEDRIYTNSDFDYNIILEDRTREVAREITKYLKSTNRMQRTIVFCANEDHAERMRVALVNENSDLVQQNPDYVVRITGSDQYGKGKIKYFISVSAQLPVIATTSKLLSTGVDVKMTKLIVLDQNISSMTEFKQMIGRGTRIREKEGKTHFTVMDLRNVTRLFADPDWDGPIEIVDDFDPDRPPPGKPPTDPPPGPPPEPPTVKPIIDENGCQVVVIGKSVSVYDVDGKLLRHENIIDYTKSNILGNYATLDHFIRSWSARDKKETIRQELLSRGIDLDSIKQDQALAGVDDFDFICHLAYDQRPLTRKERAENVKKRDFLNRYKGVAREVLSALLDKYQNQGIYEIENTDILRLEPFRQYGKPSRIAQSFGGREGYLKAVKELEQEIYKAVL